MKAKAQKVLSETKFSRVDAELDELHTHIMNNSNLHILENKIDIRAMPFKNLQDYIQLKGKRLWVDTLQIMVKR